MSLLDLDDSGQLILVTGITVVVIVIGGITVLNLASFTQAQKVSQGDDKISPAHTELIALESHVERAIRVTNNDPDTVNQLSTVTEYTSTIDSQKETISMRNGEYVRITNVENPRMGKRVWRPAYGRLNTSSTDNPYIKQGGGEISTLGLKVQEIKTGSVNIRVDSETIQLSEDASGDITVSNGGGSCEVSSDTKPVSINVFDGVVNHVDCEGISNDLDSTAAVQIENADNIEASLNMITSGSDTGDIADNGSSPTERSSLDSIEAHDAVYSVEGDVTVHTKHTTVETTVEFIPHVEQGE